MATGGSPPSHDTRYLRWIGTLQLFKGLLLVALALGFLSFVHKDVDEIAAVWLGKIGFDMANRHITDLLETLDLVTDKQLFHLSIAAFFFAGILITQGTGLLLRKQWAKYLTLVATSALIPYEAFEIAKGFGFLKLTVLVVNVAIVSFMVYLLRRKHVSTPLPASPSLNPFAATTRPVELQIP